MSEPSLTTVEDRARAAFAAWTEHPLHNLLVEVGAKDREAAFILFMAGMTAGVAMAQQTVHEAKP